MLCSRCKKRIAVVFVSMNGEGTPQGLCSVCAKELGITQVTDLMDKMGITDEMIEEASEQFENLLNSTDSEKKDELMAMLKNATDLTEDGFEPGGAPTMPNNLQHLFAGADAGESASKNTHGTDKSGKKESSRKKLKYLNTYCENLTAKARSGALDRIIGREKEISRVVQILSRRTKNNPCLIGEPGVGKTAIAEGLALRIADHDVPARLQKKELYLLDLTSLVAGTQFRGQFEGRIKGLVEEVKSEGNTGTVYRRSTQSGRHR